MSKHFPKSNSQLGIRYKLKDNIEKVAIIDFVLSDNKNVYIIEIKRSNNYLKAEQLRLYYELMNYIMNCVEDERNRKGLFIVYNKESSVFLGGNEKYILYKDLKKINTKEYLKLFFDQNAEIT